MSKSPKAFRLSEQALESLRWLVAETGTNETAIVEMSLAFLKRELSRSEPKPVVAGAVVEPVKVGKKRRRRR